MPKKNEMDKLYDEEAHTFFQLLLDTSYGKRECDYEPYPTDFTLELKKAVPLEDILMDTLAKPKGIYFSYLAEALKAAGLPARFESILPGSPTSKDMDKWVAQRMIKDGIPYEKICDCIMYSPNVANEDFSVRAQLAGAIVFGYVNALYMTPGIVDAKPLHSLDRIMAQPTDLYNSFMKAVLDRKPEMSFREAEEKAIKLMKRNQISKDVVEEVLASASFVWAKPKPYVDEPDMDYYERLAEIEQSRKEFIHEAWNKDDSAASARHDESLFADMQKSIREMTETYQQTDMVKYWNKTIEIMDWTLRKYDELELAKKTMKIWMIGVQKAVKDLGMENEKEVLTVLSDMAKLGKAFDAKTADFKEVMESVRHLEHFSQKIIAFADNRNRSNPLLAEIDIQHAEPLEKIAQGNDVLEGKPSKETARKLYASAVRAVLKEHFTRDAKQTEIAAAKYLLDHNILSCCVEAAMESSMYHNFKNKPPSERKKIVQGIMESAENMKSPPRYEK